MRIKIDSNFVIPGVEGVKEIEMNDPTVTVRTVLKELSARSAGRVYFIHPTTGYVEDMDFKIQVNGLPNDGLKEVIDVPLNEGDLVSIKLLVIGGG